MKLCVKRSKRGGKHTSRVSAAVCHGDACCFPTRMCECPSTHGGCRNPGGCLVGTSLLLPVRRVCRETHLRGIWAIFLFHFTISQCMNDYHVFWYSVNWIGRNTWHRQCPKMGPLSCQCLAHVLNFPALGRNSWHPAGQKSFSIHFSGCGISFCIIDPWILKGLSTGHS